MSAITDVRVVAAEVDVIRHRLDHPLVLSNGTVTDLPEITVRLEISNGPETAVGWGAANLSDAWAWPDPELPSSVKHKSMIDYAHRIAETIGSRVGPPAHPLELGLQLHDTILADDHEAPTLARAICGSAFDAAIHDACGQLMGTSAFALYDEPAEVPSIDHHFPGGAISAVRDVLQRPRTRLPGWWLIAPGDDLDRTAAQVARSGMSQYKIKLSGADPVADARAVAAIHTAALSWTDQAPRLSVDTNEGSASPDSIVEFLDELARISPEALAALAYLEQPTPRDSLPHHNWVEVGTRVPVLVDEALSSMDDLATATRMGWSGFAIKTCKGHSFALAAAAWARQHDLVISVQDLTNIGRSAIHSYLLAAHLPTINGIELNSPQYLPGANAPWLPRLSGLFASSDGWHSLDPDGVVGLGTTL